MNILRKVLVVAVAAVLVASLGSCGGGSGTVIIVSTGDIEVANDVFSFFFIDFVEISGPEFAQFFPFLGPGDSLLIPDVIAGNYTVTIGWTDFSTEVFPFVDVFDSSLTIVTGFN